MATIEKRFKAQRTRGTNGFGFYIPHKNRLTHNTKEGRILSLLRREEASEVLFHHRMPTSTANVRTGAHPYSTKEYFENNYIVVHNGVLRNEDALKREHEALGIKYVSVQENGRYNDSEALAFDLARYLEGQVDKLTASGSIAFIAIRRDKLGKPMQLFFGRNYGNPLMMKKTKFSLTLSSEGEGNLIEAHTLYAYSYDTGEITKRPLKIPGVETPPYRYNTSRTSTAPGWNYRAPTVSTAPEPQQSLLPKSTLEADVRDNIIEDLQERWAKDESTKKVYDRYMQENDYDLEKALRSAEEDYSNMQARQFEIDGISLDEESETRVDESLINEYCENDEVLAWLSEGIKMMRLELAELTEKVEEITGKKEEPGATPIGFHPQSTGQTYQVPTVPKPETKQIPRGQPYVD